MHQVLRLSENGIESVDRKAFMNLGTSLEQLDLSGNQLKLIEEETFRPLYGLQVSLKTMSTYGYQRRDHQVYSSKEKVSLYVQYLKRIKN